MLIDTNATYGTSVAAPPGFYRVIINDLDEQQFILDTYPDMEFWTGGVDLPSNI
jgi:hypothetical protein